MRNQYKRLDVFRCRHESHQGFGNVISAYHVLKEKACYPDGCIYFKWKCHRLERGLPCPRSFLHVGRKCTSCPEYHDEKVIKYPQLLLSPHEYQIFLKEFQEFELWLQSKKDRGVDFTGTIKAVKPRMIMNCSHGRTHLALQGFILVFKEGFVDLTPFEDTIYAILSPLQQSRLKLAEGDRLDLKATLHLDRGRLILNHVREVEIESKAGAKFWTLAEARQALLTGKILDDQYEKCLSCPHGSLVDIRETEIVSEGQKRRKLFCLKGILKPEYCIVRSSEEIYRLDHCQDEERQESKERLG
ncbi:MAG: hypothetical protein K6U11_04940 [bacterium]|nr:hypothetical protein [bacterium]